MTSPSTPPAYDPILAWVALAASGFRLRHAASILAAGGPEAVLQLPEGELAARFPGSRGRVPLGRGSDWPHYGLAASAPVGPWLKAERTLLLPPALERLRPWAAAPLVLFGRGESFELGDRPTIAIVGAREASARGTARAAALAIRCAEAGVVVVSGGARGVDLAAHEAALRAGGETWVVLAEPICVDDADMPRRIAHLRRSRRAFYISPHGPWVARDRRLWASRNAVIAALADAVVVIEGAHGSGTRYTVHAMRRLQRPVFAVPGDPDDPLSAMPNEMIRRRDAEPLLQLDDALSLVCEGRDRATGLSPPPPGAVPSPRVTLSALEEQILAAVGPPRGTRPAEELLRELGGDVAQHLAVLLELELRGMLSREGALLRRGAR